VRTAAQRACARMATAFLVMAVAICAGASESQAQNAVGSITDITGSAQLQRAGSTLNVTTSMRVELHDLLTTAAASQLTITLLDNSTLTLAESSRLTIDEDVVTGGARTSTKVSLLGGSLHSIITTALHVGASTFEVNTPNAVAAVRGTDFEMRYTTGLPRGGYPGCLEFTDEATNEGTVANWNKANPAAVVEVPAGHYTTVACAAAPTAAGTGGLGVLQVPVGPLGALLSNPLLPLVGTGAAATGIGLGIYGGLGGFSGNVASPSQP
jgi:FecR protein